jgi:hypothetical protein
MGLSTERKVFLAVLAVAGAALIIDQGILGPSEASALPDMPTPSAEAVIPEAPVPSVPATKSSETMAQVLMDRLDGIQSERGKGHSLSAAFSLERFIDEPELAQGEGATSEPQSVGNRMLDLIVADAPQMPTLSAVMPASNGGGAVLNGKLVRVGGQVTGGFTLVEVRERSVILSHDGRNYPLEMPMQTRP